MNANTRRHGIAQNFPKEAEKAQERSQNGPDKANGTQEKTNEWQVRAKIPQHAPDERPAEGQKSIPSGPSGPLNGKKGQDTSTCSR